MFRICDDQRKDDLGLTCPAHQSSSKRSRTRVYHALRGYGDAEHHFVETLSCISDRCKVGRLSVLEHGVRDRVSGRRRVDIVCTQMAAPWLL